MYSFDTEDLGKGASSVTQIGFYDGKTYTLFDGKNCKRKACDWLQKRSGKFYTFNLEYDVINIFYPDTEPIEFVKAGSRMIYARYGANHFYDLVYIGLVGMAKAAKKIGLEKGKLDATSKEYLRNDLLITYEWAKRMRDYFSNAFGVRMKSTLAGTSLKIFETFYDKHNLVLPNEEDEPFLRAGFFGGRTEVFKRGVTKNVEYFDINSLYPYCMASNMFPDIDYYKSKNVEEDLYMIDCTVTVPETYVPILAHRSEGKLLFPIGKFRGVFCSPEFERALEMGTKINRVHSVMNFPRKVRPFSEFINTIYSRRVSSDDDLEKYLLKIVMNSLYGKFATGKGIKLYKGFMDYLTETELEDRPYYANVIWSAFITSYARLRLHGLLERFNPGELIYCDTDSVIVTNKASSKLKGEINALELGKLKREDSCSFIHVRGLKFYEYESKTGKKFFKVRGVPLSEQQYYFLHGNATFKKPVKFLESQRRHLEPNLWLPHTKSAKAFTPKREERKRGITYPLCL